MCPRFNIPDIHLQIYDQLAQDYKHNLLVLPREHAKTTLLQIFALWCITFGKKHFLQIFSESKDQAKLWLEMISFELTSNPFIRFIAGDLKATQLNPGQKQDPWSSSFLVTKTGIAIEIMGWGQKPRGRKFRSFRPDLQIFDDFESEDNTNTPELRKKLLRFIYRKIMPAIDEYGGQQVFTGTIVHPDSFLQRTYSVWQQLTRAKKTSVWRCIFEIVRTNNVMLWKERYDNKWHDRKKALYEEANEIDAFYQEYYNQPVAEKNRIFKPHIRFWKGQVYWKGSRARIKGNWYKRENPELALAGQLGILIDLGEFDIPVSFAGGLDLAFTQQDKSDLTAIEMIGMDSNSNIYTMEDISGQFDYGFILEQLQITDRMYNRPCWGVETNGGQELALAAMDAPGKDGAYEFNFIKCHEHVAKSRRIERMLKPARAGTVYVNVNHMNLLEDFDNYPKPHRLDRLDALEKAVRNAFAPAPDMAYGNKAAFLDGAYDDEYMEKEVEGYMAC